MTGANPMSYEFSCISTSFSKRTTDSLELVLGNSPNSHLCNQFDCDSSLLLTSQEHPSSTETNRLNFAQNYVVCSQSMKHALQKIEVALMAPETNEAITSSTPDPKEDEQNLVLKQRSITCVPSYRPEKRQRETSESDPTKVKNLLTKCAQALADDKISDFKALVKETSDHISISGDPIQRLGTYMLEGLVARLKASGSKIYRSLRCHQPESKEVLSNMSILYNVCPYFKFGYMAANGAIAEAVRGEGRIHIIDFHIMQGKQWETLIQALAARPAGPPHVRITGIDDPVNESASGDDLQLVGSMLSDMAKKFRIPLEFNALSVFAPEVTREMLDIRPGETLAVNFAFQLHHTPDESVDVNNPRDGLLRMVKGLSPKVITLVEQESNTNTTPFLMRFEETMKYYSAMFESIDVNLSRESKERINVEKHCLAKDIVNIIACEGKERIERHEVFGKWRSRLTMAGFRPFPLNSHVNSVIRQLLGHYSDKYTLMEIDGVLLLGWRNRNLISASAWH